MCADHSNEEGNHKGILRNIITVNFFFRIFQASFMFMLPLYGLDKGWSDSHYGFVLAIGGFTAMAVTFFLGILVDMKFKRTTMIIGLFATIISALIFTRVDDTALTIAFYSLYAVGMQLMMISTNTFIANETKKGADRTKGFSGNLFFAGIGRMFAPLACGYLLIFLDFDSVFAIMAMFGAIALMLVLTLKLGAEETPKEEIEYAENISVDSGDDYSTMQDDDKGKMSILGVQVSFAIGKMLMGFASGIAIPFISWYILSRFEPSTEVWGLVCSMSYICMSLGYLLMAHTAEKVGKANIVLIFWLLVIPCALGIALSSSFLWISVFFVARRFFAMTPGAAWNSFLFEWIPPKHRGKTLGMLQVGQRGARSTGTLVGGFAFGALGVALFPLAMVAYPIAGLLPLIQSRRAKKKMDHAHKEYDPTLQVMGEDVK